MLSDKRVALLSQRDTGGVLTEPHVLPPADLRPVNVNSTTISSSSDRPHPSSARPSIPVLTGLRGLLAVWILLHNYRDLGPAPDLLQVWLVQSGSSAVSAFFVLSGFILTYNYGDHAFSSYACCLSFLGRRYARMLPLYYLSTLIFLGAIRQAVRASPPDGLTALHYAAYLLGMNTWWPWPYDDAVTSDRGAFIANVSLWSIQTELAFYCAFPGLLRLFRWLLGISRVTGIGLGEVSEVSGRAWRLLSLICLFSITSLIPTLLMCYGPSERQQATLQALFGVELSKATECLGDWFVFLYAAPWCRVSEFILGMLCAQLYLLTVEAQAGGSEDGDGESQSALVRFVSSSWLLHSPWVLLTWTVLLAVLLVELANPAWDLRGRETALGVNPGSFSVGFMLLIFLMCSTAGPFTRKARPGGWKDFNLVAFLLTLPPATAMGEVSFAFYAFHYCPPTYVDSIGLPMAEFGRARLLCHSRPRSTSASLC